MRIWVQVTDEGTKGDVQGNYDGIVESKELKIKNEEL